MSRGSGDCGRDRNRTRLAVGEGFPCPLFRLRDGVTVSPWRTFSEAPLKSWTVGFPESSSKPWHITVDLPKLGEVKTLVRVHPCHSWFAHSLTFLSRQLRLRRFYQAGRLDSARRPPSVQSPFAQLGCYLRWRDVFRLLGGRYPSVIARTGSCAAPVELSPPSAFGLVWRVLAGCNQSLLPTAVFPTLFREPFLGCWIPYPGGTPFAHACFFHGVIGLPKQSVGRLPASILRTTSRRACFRGCRYFVMFRPPSLLAPRIVPTAANTAAGQLGLLRPGLSCVVAAERPGYANRPNTVNWRYGDLHPARLSALSAAPLPSMSSSASPGSRPLHVASCFAVRICHRRGVIGSALPMLESVRTFYVAPRCLTIRRNINRIIARIMNAA